MSDNREHILVTEESFSKIRVTAGKNGITLNLVAFCGCPVYENANDEHGCSLRLHPHCLGLNALNKGLLKQFLSAENGIAVATRAKKQFLAAQIRA